ncbi:Por secretion system C-terminal sorting domain-containing protein [Catalinimonas alkaloidigena]|uniref:Por secretion system C-terminal sorting domain-containing protein n=1 Tax=Catalinimonas alkaloidigena TaxID=1075417 RepID=A0A1G9SJN8_9BACT|nr:choice-of-anchor tandem repeat GloVer-containing protein [Catalinimonas alkaloidigena]SDM35698.1 Por secretion system C-terminal sorting domain-containing protein [Catalinimonas alkaloidigena]
MTHFFHFPRIVLVLLVGLFYLPLHTTYAQTRLYGATTYGAQGTGSLFSINPDGSDYRNEYVFPDLSYGPADRPVQASNGLFYSVTTKDGDYGYGLIFSTAPSGAYTRLHAFSAEEGAGATGLTQGPDGALYGMTTTAFYRITPDGDFRIVRSFSMSEGQAPVGSLIYRDGYFYGNTTWGGANNLGTLFRLKPDGSAFQKLRDMSEADGGRAIGQFLELNGYFYGVALGSFQSIYWSYTTPGSVFRMRPDGTEFEPVHLFASPYFPVGEVVQAPNGYLYGIARRRISADVSIYVTYKMQPDGSDYTIVGRENLDADDVFTPATNYVTDRILKSLTIGPDGLLYGFYEGLYDGGRNSYAGATVIFRIEANDEYSLVKKLSVNDHPIGSFTVGDDGLMYILTDRYISGILSSPRQSGGFFLRINPQDNSSEVVHRLGAFNGENCDAQTLIQVSDYLYGACRQGGMALGGTFFRYHIPSGTFEKLHDFDSYSFPGGKLALVDDQLYGVVINDYLHGVDISSYGSAINVYHIGLDGSNFTELTNFYPPYGGGGYARNPWSGLIYGSDGYFYIPNGGHSDASYGDDAAILKATLNGDTVTEIVSFRSEFPNDYISQYGFEPHELMEGSDDLLYAMFNSEGAYAQGALVRVSKDGSMKQNLHNFAGSDGAFPFGGLIEGPGGMLYGMTRAGGTHDLGTLFRLKTNGFDFQKLYDFSPTSGGAPVGSLTLGADGFLYGMTREEGSHDFGTLFRLKTDGSAFTLLHDFARADGIHPQGALVLVGDSTPMPSLSLEAECVEVGAAWRTESSTLASHEAFVYAPTSHFQPTGQASDRLRFTFSITQPDAYTLAARVRAISHQRNSFWVRLNGGAWQRWDLPVSPEYQWVALPFSDTALGVGAHVLEVEFREFRTHFDKLVLTPGALPTDLGPEATNCTPPPVDYAAYFEAECAQYGSNWRAKASNIAAHGAYLYVPFSSFYAPWDGSNVLYDMVTFTLPVPQRDHYTLWARVRAISHQRNSFWVRLNGGPWQRWDLPVSPEYQWVALPFSGSELLSGPNLVDFSYRESYTQLDQLFVTNTDQVPSGQGAASNCDDERPRSEPASPVAPGLVLYPNPTKDRFVLTASDVALSQAQVHVSTLEGRTLPHVPTRLQGNGWEVDLSAQPAGVYLIKVTTPDRVYTQRVVKQ